jgi:hypothetical protein
MSISLPTTSESVHTKALSSGTAVKMKKVAETWDMKYIDMYNFWGKLCYSKDGLRPLEQLSGLVDRKRGLELLEESRKTYGRSKVTLSDMKSAVAKARDEGASILRDSGVRSSQLTPIDNTCRTPARYDAHVLPPLASPQYAASLPPALAAHTTPARFDARDPPSSTPPQYAASLPPMMAVNLPPTPVSSLPASVAEMVTDAAKPKKLEVDTQSSPLKRKRPTEGSAIEHSIMVADDGSTIDEPPFPTSQEMQSVYERLVQGKWINDDCLNKLLVAFNPDVSLWYIASTHLLSVGKHDSAVPSKFKDSASLPRMLMFPIHVASVAHWTLATFDRTKRHCVIFDALGERSAAQPTWDAVQAFLTRHGVLDGAASVDLDPFPSIRQNDGSSCGIFVIAVAIHMLHGRTVESITPGLWRELLASFFSIQIEPPRGWMESQISDLFHGPGWDVTQSMPFEPKLGAVEAMKTKVLEVQSNAREAALLSSIANTQAAELERREECRERLDQMSAWLSSMPAHANGIMREFIHNQTESTGKDLKSLPELLEGGSRQLRLLARSCSAVNEDCSRAVLALKQKRETLVRELLDEQRNFNTRLAALDE